MREIDKLRSMTMRNLAFTVLAFCLGWMPIAGATDLDRPRILVAKPELHGQIYGSTVLVVTPLGGDQHAGFIVNRPTGVTLGNMFPEHGPSQKVPDPVYLGGPIQPQAIFALVQRPDSPGGNSFEMMPGLFAAFDAAVVDRIIESEPTRARFVAGLVAWRAGELRDEIKQGAWYVLEPDAALLMRNPDGLWEDLVRRSARISNTI
jgi:putative transcriptional regulator